MSTEPQADKKPRKGMVVLKFPPPVYSRLEEVAERVGEQEGRGVSVTEIVRRAALELAQAAA